MMAYAHSSTRQYLQGDPATGTARVPVAIARRPTSIARVPVAVGSAIILLLLLMVPCSGTAFAGQHHTNPAPHNNQNQHQNQPKNPAPTQPKIPAPTQPKPPASAPEPRAGQPQAQPNVQSGARQEHLAEWMNRHQTLAPQEQQKALELEPGFKQLPLETQERMRQRLAQLNSMPPQQRERVLGRVEAMEKLTPQQRAQVRNATQQWGALPEDRRRMVGKAFRDLREMPADQRQAIVNSDRFKTQFNDEERGVLGNLLTVEPYMPADRANSNIQSGGKQ